MVRVSWQKAHAWLQKNSRRLAKGWRKDANVLCRLVKDSCRLANGACRLASGFPFRKVSHLPAVYLAVSVGAMSADKKRLYLF